MGLFSEIFSHQMIMQRTLEKSTSWLHGVHLDRDGRSGVRFHPAKEDEGIVFVRSDLPGEPEVRCLPDRLKTMPRWTSLEEDGNWVHHTEHVLAAIAFSGVDNLRVEMNSDRLPFMSDGSCAAFYDLIQYAGLACQDLPRRVYSLKEPAFFLDGRSTTGAPQNVPSVQYGRYILAIPSDGYSISTVFHWSHMDSLPVGVAEFEAGNGKIERSLLTSRSYLVETEKEHIHGLLGPIEDRVMMLYPDCPPALAQEAARHKIVDFVGDMMILGKPLVGRYVAFRAGHSIHHDFLHSLIARDLLECIDQADPSGKRGS